MKRIKKIATSLLLGTLLIELSGCAVQPEGLSLKPVVQRGAKTALKSTEYISLIAAGSEVPFYVGVKGNIFKNDVNKTIPLVLKYDLYVYGDTQDNETIWVSYDKIHWYTIDEVFEGEISFMVHHTVEGSSINFDLEVNKKQEM